MVLLLGERKGQQIKREDKQEWFHKRPDIWEAKGETWEERVKKTV